MNKKAVCAAICGCALAGVLTAVSLISGAEEKTEMVEWNAGNWSVTGSGSEAEYTAPENNFLGGIETKEALSYNCIEYDVRALDTYETVDGNVGFCYRCGDTEYFFELNTVGNYLRIRRIQPTEALKTSNTAFTMKKGKWYRFRIIVAPGLLRWYIDDALVAECRNTSECAMDKGRFWIQGYNAQPQVKNIVFSNADVSVTVPDFEFEAANASKMFTWTPFDGSGSASPAAGAEDGQYVWPLSGSLTSIELDVAPGDAYSMKLPLRNTFCVRLKNDSDATKLKLSFITDSDGEYDDKKSKEFDILPRSGYFTYYFNISDVKGASGYLRGFRLETVDAKEGTAYIDAITFEREAKIYNYAGSVSSCTASGEEITVKGTLKPEYAGKNVRIYETTVSNYNFAKSKMTKVTEITADGTEFTVTFPLMNKKMTRLSSHFFAEVDGVFVSPWFKVENYYDYSENPYRFDIPMNLIAIVTEGKYGAVGDGFTNDTTAIQKAIDDVSAAGGGMVIIPGDLSEYGKRYIVTTLEVKSNVWLYIDENAVLWQSPRKADYPYDPAIGHDVSIPGVNWTHAGLCHNYPLVIARKAHNFKITGKGMLRLNDAGSECEDGVDGSTIWTGCETRIHLIALALVECTDAQVSGITIHRANCYHFSLFACSRVYVSDVTMNEATCASGDGIGLSSATHDIKIDRCFLFSNDDAVTLTSSYNDPRGLVWWEARTDRDNSVHDVEVCHSDFFGGHGITFITWGTDNPDLSRQEIYNVRVYDNVLSGGSSVGTWCDNPYYGGPFDNTETDDYSPVRDVRIYNNKYLSSCSLLSVKPTNFISDCKINSASDFQNGDFERRNGKSGWISGLSNWSNYGDRSNLSVTEAGGDHFASVGGNVFMYQGLYFKKSTVTVEFDFSIISGGAEFLIVDAVSGDVLVCVPLSGGGNTGAAPSEHFSWTGALDKGTYLVGVRTAEGAQMYADNFSASLAMYSASQAIDTAGTGETLTALSFSTDVLYIPSEPEAITFPRYLAETLPRDDRTPGEVVPIEPSATENGDDIDPGEKHSVGKLPTGAKIAICAGAAALVLAAAAVIIAVKRKKKGRGVCGIGK